MDKRLFVTQSFHLGGLAFLLVGLAVACEQEPSKSNSNPGPAGGTTGTGTGGSSSGTGGLNGEGGEDGRNEVRKGERGSSCDASNDCEEGLSCIVSSDCPVGVACANKSCQPSNFDIMGTGKQCHIVDCAKTEDCCGDKPLEEPEKCADRDLVCNQPTLPGCTTNAVCLDDSDCGPGTCTGACSYDLEPCLTTADCATNTCDTTTDPPTCTLTLTDCSDTACATVTNTCATTLRCTGCENPDYDTSDPICSDPDCEGICGFVCEDERCVIDDSCKADTDCAATTTPFCDDTGTCVECLTSDDCEDEECTGGRCGPECEVDTQCSLFEACKANECVYVGCQSDRECVLSAGNNTTNDPRLAKCSIEGGVGTCVFPCEIDAQCAPTQVCLENACEYIGCETDSECKTIAGLHNMPIPTEERPWVTTAACRAETPPAP